MHLRPIDLVLRAILEIAAAIGLALGGLALAGGIVGWLLALALPIGAAACWATFRVPGDPGPSPWPIPGAARLLLELVLLGAGAVGWLLAGWPLVGLLVAALIGGHCLMTADRIRWLLEHR